MEGDEQKLRINGYHFFRMYLIRIVFGVLICSIFVGCGGTQSTPAISIHQADASPALIPVLPSSLPPSTVRVSASYALDQGNNNRTQGQGQRHLAYISSANLSLSVVVTPVGGTASSPYVGSCTTASCTVTFTANPGPTMLVFTLTDTAGGGGNVLSTFTTMQIIQPQTLNTLSFTANPVVNSIVITPAYTTVNAGTPTSIPVAVSALDADGKTIVGSGNYVNSSGAPFAILLNAVNSQNDGYGSLSMTGPLRLTASGQAASYAHYDGNWLDSGTITVTTTLPITGSITVGTVTTTPKVSHEYSLSNSSAQPGLITTGPDGNLWFGEENVNKVAKLNPTTGTFTEYTLPSSNANTVAITSGPDGKLWFLENAASKVGVLTPSGTLTEYSSTYAYLAQYITLGPDGELWFTSGTGNNIVRITTTGILNQFSLLNSNSFPYGITAGPDGNLWFTERTSNVVAKMTTSGVELVDYTIPTSNALPNGITAGSDGNLWFTEENSNKIGMVTTSGTFSEYSIPTPNSSPTDIHPGPDGALYFVELNKNQIGRVTTSGTITEVQIPTGSSNPGGVTMGPDGNVWFTEYSSAKVGKLIY